MLLAAVTHIAKFWTWWCAQLRALDTAYTIEAGPLSGRSVQGLTQLLRASRYLALQDTVELELHLAPC